MTRRLRKDSIRNHEAEAAEPYVTWSGAENQANAMVQFSKSLEHYRGIKREKSVASYRENYSDLDTGVSGRPGLTWDDYDAFRPGEARPRKHSAIILAADKAYEDEGIVKNIIDLMGDFGCQGVRVVHPNKKIEKFFRNWWKRVEGTDRSERFLNYLYRIGTVAIRKQTAKISSKVEQDIYKSTADPDIQVNVNKVTSREIPWRYTFLHPATMTVVGGPLASFTGIKRYGMVLPTKLARTIKNPKTNEEKALVADLPLDIRNAAETKSIVLLPEDKTLVFSYKKDDWQEWALPMTYSIMEDLMTLKKLKLADRAALDGAISNIRIWRLGSLEHGVAPNPAAAARLSDILENSVGVGTVDLVWDAAIDLLESKSTIHQFLGEEKYRPTMNNIYAGLGIPPTLTGTLGAAGTTNNFISLKTLTQRLEYGRSVLRKFWEAEFVEIQKAMGFRFAAKLEFDQNNLADEDAIKSLLVQLVDRSLISDELLQERFGIDPDMERIRLNREQKDRERGALPPKAGAFHDPQFGLALKKIALQSGVVGPSQIGLRKDAVHKDLQTYDKEPGEKSGMEFKSQKQKEKALPGVSGQGRPKNKKDSIKRKVKKFTPKSKALLEIWAGVAQEAIASYLHDDLLAIFKKKNMRSLTVEQARKAEEVKFGVLFNLEPLGPITETVIANALAAGIPNSIKSTYGSWANQISEELNRQLTTEETRKLQAVLYAEFMGDDNG